MPRGRKAGSVTETLEQQIEKAQQKVIKTKLAYDQAVDTLQKLLDKRDAQRKEDLWNAIIKSERSIIEAYMADVPYQIGGNVLNTR